MTEQKARLDSLGGVHCAKCDKVLDGKIVPKTDEPIKAVRFQKCRACRHYNVIDYEDLTCK